MNCIYPRIHIWITYTTEPTYPPAHICLECIYVYAQSKGSGKKRVYVEFLIYIFELNYKNLNKIYIPVRARKRDRCLEAT